MIRKKIRLVIHPGEFFSSILLVRTRMPDTPTKRSHNVCVIIIRRLGSLSAERKVYSPECFEKIHNLAVLDIKLNLWIMVMNQIFQ